MKILALVLCSALVGCGLLGPRPVQTVEVQVPIPVRVLPPADLISPPPVTVLPQFVGPLTPGASACLTPEGEQRFKAMLLEQEARRQALKTWAETAP